MKTEQEKIRRATSIVDGMSRSACNAVLFDHGSPEVWFQFYLGLYLDKPTIIMIKAKNITDETEAKFAHPLVKKVVVVEEYNDASAQLFADACAEVVRGKAKNG